MGVVAGGLRRVRWPESCARIRRIRAARIEGTTPANRRGAASSATTPVLMRQWSIRRRFSRAAIATVVPALFAVQFALADDGQADMPVESTPNETRADSRSSDSGGEAYEIREHPADRYLTPGPHRAETLSGAEAPGEDRAGDRATPAPGGDEHTAEDTAANEVDADGPGTPDRTARQMGQEATSADGVPAETPGTPDRESPAIDRDTAPPRVLRIGETPTPAPGAVDGETGTAALRRPREREPLRPIEEIEVNPDKVTLGRALFHDPRLSEDNSTACVSCHDLANGGDDGLRVSVGVGGKLGAINSPTVFNAGLNFKQFWDGRAETLEQQIDGPVQSAVELGSLWPVVIAKLYAHESYPGRFNAIYPDGINRKNVKNALAEFMKSLTTPNSRFDQWLRGDDNALTALEEHGYNLFKHYGCVSCHQGANVGGNMFQVFGVLNNYFERRGNITDADLGRYNVTGEPADRHAFKVPSLRMAALTAPYLHDGSAATLRDAVDAMFEFQLGRTAPDEDKEAIVAFIKTLPGENKELFP